MKNNVKKYIALFVAIILLIFDYTFTGIVKKKYAVPISSSQITQVNDESIYSSIYCVYKDGRNSAINAKVCINCQKFYYDEEKFCSECGKELTFVVSNYYDNETLVSTRDNEPNYAMIMGLSQITLASVVLLLALLNR